MCIRAKDTPTVAAFWLSPMMGCSNMERVVLEISSGIMRAACKLKRVFNSLEVFSRVS